MKMSLTLFRAAHARDGATELNEFSSRSHECRLFMEKLNRIGERNKGKPGYDPEEVSNVEDQVILSEAEIQDLSREFDELALKYPLAKPKK